MGNVYSEEMVEFLKRNNLYKEYNPKDYIRKMEIQKEIGCIDDSLILTMSVKPSERKIKEYKKKIYDEQVTFGIILAIKNTNEDYLRQMIESVLAQTYDRLYLYIVDYSDKAHAYVANICTDYEDGRIIYRKYIDGQSISWDCFVCDYLVFVNEVDALSTIALSVCADEIERNKADIIYSDSAIFKKKKYNVIKCILKPDYAPHNLETYNYIGDFWVAKRELLVDELFSVNNESSQNYRLLRKICSKTKSIAHIRKCIYLVNVNKNYSLKLKKRDFLFKDQPLVSIIIKSIDDIQDITRIITSIYMMTTYSNYEIIILESDINSANPLIYRYYKLLNGIGNVHFYKVDKNMDIQKAYNYAAKRAAGKYMIFINNSVEISSYEWIEEMLVFAQDDNVGLVSPKVLRGKEILYCGGYIDFEEKNLVKYETAKNKDFTRDVTIASNYCFMIEKKKFDLMGGFDDQFSKFGFEIDLSLNSISNNYYNVYSSNAIINAHKLKVKYSYDTAKKLKEKWSELIKYDRFREKI